MPQNKINENDVLVPLDVPKQKEKEFVKNYLELTKNTGNLMLFAGDQKIEHLNDDFYGDGISKDDASPKHLFEIASSAKIGCFATQFGLISRYGRDYSNIPYLVKLNSKSNLVKTFQDDPQSTSLTTLKDVVELKEEKNLKILGVGYSIYVGSKYEHIMLSEAAQVIHQAHEAGLVTLLWGHARGRAVKNGRDAHLLAGVAGVSACLGADFVKIDEPESENPIESLKEAVMAAGNTKVICAGGESIDEKLFLERLYEQIHTAGTCGNGTGRNIHQKPLAEAIKMANAIYAISIENKTPSEAFEIYQGK